MMVHGNKGGHLFRVVANVPWYQKQYLVQLPEIVGFSRTAGTNSAWHLDEPA